MSEEEMPCITLEELAESVGTIEDKVWIAAQDSAASRFLLGNLVLELGRAGTIDTRKFIDRLLTIAPLHPDQPKAIQEFLEELRRHLPVPDANGEGGAPGVPPVFH